MLRRLSRTRSRGATAVEMAVVTALIAGTILFGGYMLHGRAHRTFAQVAEFQPAIRARKNGLAPPPKKEASFAEARVFAESTDGKSNLWGVGAVLLLGLVAEAQQLVRRRRKHAAEEHGDEDPSHLPDRLFRKRQDLLRRLTQASYRGAVHSVRMSDVMSSHIQTLTPYAPLDHVRRLMHEQRVRHILVCDGEGRMLGVISDRDLTQRVGRYARDIMSAKILSAAPETELIPAVTMMMNRGISALPVLQQGKPIGILTTTDVMLVLQCLMLIKQRDELATAETL